jgi:hypothetical protein
LMSALPFSAIFLLSIGWLVVRQPQYTAEQALQPEPAPEVVWPVPDPVRA